MKETVAATLSLSLALTRAKGSSSKTATATNQSTDKSVKFVPMNFIYLLLAAMMVVEEASLVYKKVLNVERHSLGGMKMFLFTFSPIFSSSNLYKKQSLDVMLRYNR